MMHLLLDCTLGAVFFACALSAMRCRIPGRVGKHGTLPTSETCLLPAVHMQEARQSQEGRPSQAPRWPWQGTA